MLITKTLASLEDGMSDLLDPSMTSARPSQGNRI
jgi:hypothetical protein